jgi:hypothetical protein
MIFECNPTRPGTWVSRVRGLVKNRKEFSWNVKNRKEFSWNVKRTEKNFLGRSQKIPGHNPGTNPRTTHYDKMTHTYILYHTLYHSYHIYTQYTLTYTPRIHLHVSHAPAHVTHAPAHVLQPERQQKTIQIHNKSLFYCFSPHLTNNEHNP